MALQESAQLLRPTISMLDSLETFTWPFKKIDAASATENLPTLEHYVERISIRKIFERNEIFVKLRTKVSEESVGASNVSFRFIPGHYFEPFFDRFHLIVSYVAFASQDMLDDLIHRTRRENFPIHTHSSHVFRERGCAGEDIRGTDILLEDI